MLVLSMGRIGHRELEKKGFYKKEEMEGFMVHMAKPLWVTGKMFITDSGLCVLDRIILIVEKGIFGLELIKKRCYWTKGVPEEDIIWNMY